MMYLVQSKEFSAKSFDKLPEPFYGPVFKNFYLNTETQFSQEGAQKVHKMFWHFNTLFGKFSSRQKAKWPQPRSAKNLSLKDGIIWGVAHS